MAFWGTVRSRDHVDMLRGVGFCSSARQALWLKVRWLWRVGQSGFFRFLLCLLLKGSAERVTAFSAVTTVAGPVGHPQSSDH